MEERIEIQLSKNKLFLGIGGSILFVVLGIWIFSNASNFEEHTFRLLRNPIIVKGVGILGVLFFGMTGTFGLKKLFDKRAGLIIDSKGITDNSNASSIGLIEWNDISEIATKQVMSTKFILIKVTNPEAYIAKAKSKLKAKLMRSNMKMYGTPLSIASNTLKYNFEELEKLIHTQYERNKILDKNT